jgi:hypothetical protein
MHWFKKHKRRMMLRQFQPKPKHRVRLDFSMPLTGEGTLGMPHEVKTAFETVANLENGINEAEVDGAVDPQTVEFYATDKSPTRFMLLTSIELQDIYVWRPKTRKKPTSKKPPGKHSSDVELRFVTTVPIDKAQLGDLWDHLGMHFWGAFDPSQGVVKTNGAEKGKSKTKSTKPLPFPPPEKSGKDAAAGKDD